MEVHIEVAVSEGVSKTEKGRLLERLGKDVLHAMQFEVSEEVRITGMEVDLLAKHKMTSEEIYVECKAYRDSLSADVITKLLGNITINSVSAGWLISTGELGKDAKGLMLTWESKNPEVRRKLQIYTPDRLIDLLISSGRIKDPSRFISQEEYQSESICLLITNHGHFWAVPIIHVTAGVPYGVMLFDAFSGQRVTNIQIIEDVSKCDSSLRELEWIHEEHVNTADNSTALIEESQSIVTVAAGDQWADYRPSRPEDFVGREDVQQEVFKFFDAVRSGTISTRLLALKAPSGWGKSSILLKLIDKADSSRNKNKYFIYAVDVRAATSQRYSDFALMACLKAAIDAGFVSSPPNPIRISATQNSLNDSSIYSIFKQLKEEQKVLVLLFDQFEEIFSKKELSTLFDNIRQLCNAVDSAQENFVLGFAWKTDGAVPTDHPAYHMWHSLSDRRREFILTPFSSKDISNALRIFSRELEAPLNPILKRHLMDHCQGYPWLLKKLCIHVYSLLQSGIEQNDILGRGLNIGELFERDLSELSGAEFSCVKKVAKESPADFFQVAEIYGAETVQILLNRRLVIRRGHRLTLYWDIFRDYVLTGSVPQIPISYLPQTAFRRYFNTVTLLATSEETDSAEIASSLGIGKRAADNIVRDMVMVGNVERSGEKLRALQKTETAILHRIFEFLRNHVVFKEIIEVRGSGFSISLEEFRQHLKASYSSSSATEVTLNQYANTLISWFRSIGLIEIKGVNIVHAVDTSNRIISKVNVPRLRKRRFSHFLGDAPAHRVLETIVLINGGVNEETLIKRGYRNSVAVLHSLDSLVKEENGVLRLTGSSSNLEQWLATKVLSTETIIQVKQALEENPNLNAIELGSVIGQFLKKNWSEASCRRYGGSLLKWLGWIEVVQNGRSF